MEKELQVHVHVLTSPRTSSSRITGTSTSVLVNAVDVHLHGHVHVHVPVDVLVDVAVDASVDVFVDVFIHVFVDASVDVTFYVLVDANVHAHVDERPCMLCTDLHAMYGLCSAIISRPCMPLQHSHMHISQSHQVLQEDVTQQDPHPKPISCSRLIREVPLGAPSFCPCPCLCWRRSSRMAKMPHQVVQVAEVLVCRHSSHCGLRWCA